MPSPERTFCYIADNCSLCYAKDLFANVNSLLASEMPMFVCVFLRMSARCRLCCV